jgi:hypothetical protein
MNRTQLQNKCNGRNPRLTGTVPLKFCTQANGVVVVVEVEVVAVMVVVIGGVEHDPSLRLYLQPNGDRLHLRRACPV